MNLSRDSRFHQSLRDPRLHILHRYVADDPDQRPNSRHNQYLHPLGHAAGWLLHRDVNVPERLRDSGRGLLHRMHSMFSRLVSGLKQD